MDAETCEERGEAIDFSGALFHAEDTAMAKDGEGGAPVRDSCDSLALSVLKGVAEDIRYAYRKDDQLKNEITVM